MKVSDFLEKSKELISSPDKWTRNTFARDNDDEPVSEFSKDACKFCMIGAMHVVENMHGCNYGENFNYFSAKGILEREIGEYLGRFSTVPHFNDSCVTSHSVVMKVFDNAIKTAKDMENGKIDYGSLILLKKMRVILESPSAWMQGSAAEDAEGRTVSPWVSTACKFCMFGALTRARFSMHDKDHAFNCEDNVAYILKEEILLRGKHHSVVDFNDSETTTHKDVLELLDSVISKKG